MNGTLEIYTNREWMILPSFVHGILPTVMYNSQNHSRLGIDREKKSPMAINANGRDIFREYEITDDGKTYPMYDGWQGIDYLKDLKQPFVNVIPIDGPITRNGGACSYGSKDIRDWMMKASDNPYCQGHLLVVNTPGGSAWAKNDFQQGIDYAHSRGLRVIDLVDGMSASAGEYLASLCDEVYVVNLSDEMGCVGVMASFFTMKNGSKNQFTDETYREYYDPESVDKNKEIRDIAEEEDATLLIEELKKLGVEFRADMKKAFPNATDDHLKGKMFAAKDVMGILCDGQMLLGDAINRVFALGSGAEKPIERTADRKMGKRLKVGTAAQRQTIFNNNNNPEINMASNYQTVAKMIGVDELVVTNEGTHLDVSLLDTLQTNIEALQAEAAKVADLTQQLEDSKKALADTTANFESQIASLNETINANAEAANANSETISNLTTELEGAKAALATAEQIIAERDQQISDLNAQVEELQNTPGDEPDAGEAPKNNGDGASAAYQASNAPQWDPTKSAVENKKATEEYMKQLKSQIR